MIKNITFTKSISVLTSSDNEEMNRFNTECSEFFKDLLKFFIEEGIAKGELIPEALHLINGLKAAERGFLFFKWTEKKEVSEDFRIFLDTIFDLIEVKK